MAPMHSIMPLGDSITEGGIAFASYRLPLWEKLMAGGYDVRYVGSRHELTRAGRLAHEGYSGKPVEYLASQIERLYRGNPADIVLLHAGHNYHVEQRPVPTILDATRTIISTIHQINPHAVLLVAQVIPSGKLPKYAYLPRIKRTVGHAGVRGG